MSDIRTVHGFTFFHTLGGAQAMLRRNWEGDARHGVASRFVIYFEPDDDRTERVRGLGLTWRHTIHQARNRFRQRLPTGAEVIVYNDIWGLPFFADLDQAPRRIGILHGASRELPNHIRAVRGLLDGMLCVSRVFMEQVAQLLPELSPDRVAFLPNPAGRDRVEISQPALAGRPLVIGYSGRLIREQKRVDRLPVLARELDRLGLDYRLEVLGDGPELKNLQRHFAGHGKVRFHGWLKGAKYWEVAGKWDVVILFSDCEAISISLLEGLSVGAIPLFPDIGSHGGAYAKQVRPDLLYPAGDMAAAARVLQSLTRLTDEKLFTLRRRCGEIVQPHLGECDLAATSEFVHRIRDRPRISRGVLPRRPFYWHDHCPFGLLRRLYYPGLWRGSLAPA